jgi:DNA-binding winged helix-turn-helix (wHTH) protein/TolB-like protein
MAEPTRIRFGLFDFDPATRELRRSGTPVRLAAQPAQVLGVLLAQAGEVVTREALQQAVWGSDTFVDFDSGLNFCIAQIRTALGDSADSPRYVKTVPKRGYQFIAPVAPPGTPPPPRDRRREWRRLLAPALLVGLMAVIALLYSHPWTAPPLMRIAVVHFDNETGNPEFDHLADALTDSVTAELAAAGDSHYSVIGNAKILRVPRNQRDLKAIAASLGVRYVIIGQVQDDPLGVRVLAHLIRVPEQTHVLVARLERKVNDTKKMQAEIARSIADQLGPRLAVLSTASK